MSTAPPVNYASQPLPTVAKGQSIKADHFNALSRRLTQMVPSSGSPFVPFARRSTPALFVANEKKPIDTGIDGDSTIEVRPVQDKKASRSSANEHDADLGTIMRVRKRAYTSIKKWELGILVDCGQDMPIFESLNRPDLVFQQNNSEMPADGEFWPAFVADQDLVLVGVTPRATAGTYSMKLRAGSTTGTIIAEFDETDQDTFIELNPVGVEIYESETVWLEMVSSSSVENFFLYVKAL